EFVGLGGDDFIVVADYHKEEPFCENVIDMFKKQFASLYREIDLQNGFITSKNRHGVTETFSIASISITGIKRTAMWRNFPRTWRG
ncbi:MAG: hypothetical protein LBB68_11955, partial [Treponema sp.]|nr:hypothetical protein [Treponema sp.]